MLIPAVVFNNVKVMQTYCAPAGCWWNSGDGTAICGYGDGREEHGTARLLKLYLAAARFFFLSWTFRVQKSFFFFIKTENASACVLERVKYSCGGGFLLRHIPVKSRHFVVQKQVN